MLTESHSSILTQGERWLCQDLPTTAPLRLLGDYCCELYLHFNHGPWRVDLPAQHFVHHISKNSWVFIFFLPFRAYGLYYQLISYLAQVSPFFWDFTTSHVRRESGFIPPVVTSGSTSLSLGPQTRCPGTSALPVTTPSVCLDSPVWLCCSDAILMSFNPGPAIGSNLGPCLHRTSWLPQSPVSFVSWCQCL